MKKALLLALVLVFFCTGAMFAQTWDFWGSLSTGIKLGTFGGFGQKDWDGPVYSVAWNPGTPDATTAFGSPDYYNWWNKGYYTWTATGERKFYAPSMSLTTKEDGNYFDINAMYGHRFFGFYTMARFIAFMEDPVEIHGLYGWINFLDESLTIKIGRIKDHVNLRKGRGYIEALFPLYAAPGAKDCEYSYAEGDGVRIEWTGVPGLNVGVAFYIPNINQDVYLTSILDDDGTGEDRNYGKDPVTGKVQNYYKNQMGFNGWADNAKNAKIIDVLRNVRFGMEYRAEKIHVAAGFALDGEADGLNDSSWGTTYFGEGLWDLTDGPTGATTSGVLLDNLNNENGDAILWYMGQGMKGYVGVNLKMLNPFGIKLGGQIYNLGIFNEYGWVHLNESLSYSFKWRFASVSLSALQTIFNIDDHRKDGFAIRYGDDKHTWSTRYRSKVVYTFTPSFDFFPKGNLHGGLSVPVTFWPGIVNYDISIKPSLTYFYGKFLEKGLSVSAEYVLGFLQFSKYSNNFGDNKDGNGKVVGTFRNSDVLVRNTLQVSVGVSW